MIKKPKIICDSINPKGKRLCSMILTYPRYIHAEFMTHRVFSRNAASSRAIPVKRMLELVQQEPVLPVMWGANQPGMQSFGVLPPEKAEHAKQGWLDGRDRMLTTCKHLMDIGLHKQWANRVIETWMHITIIATSSEWENFFALRSHKDAMPDFQALADAMLYEFVNHEPTPLKPGEWHIPFADRDIAADADLDTKIKICVARCARISYLNFEGQINVQDDVELHDKLANSGHWSPFEHVAQCMDNVEPSGNFRGWKQYRKKFPTENRSIDLKRLLQERVDSGSKYATGFTD